MSTISTMFSKPLSHTPKEVPMSTLHSTSKRRAAVTAAAQNALVWEQNLYTLYCGFAEMQALFDASAVRKGN